MAKVEKTVPGNDAPRGESEVPADLVLAKLEELYPAVEELKEKMASIPPVIRNLVEQGERVEGFADRLEAVEKIALKMDLDVAPPPVAELYAGLKVSDVFCSILQASIQAQFTLLGPGMVNKPPLQSEAVRTAISMAMSGVMQALERLPKMSKG